MSRQIKMQMPQTQKKKIDKNACLLVFILIISGILIFLLLTASDNKKLNSTLNETFDFAKTRLERYEIYNTNDQVKSLTRLMDKTTELSRVIAQEDNLSEAMLDESIYTSELGIAFKKGTHEEVAQGLTETLEEMQNEGITEEIVKKYGLDADEILPGGESK